MLGDLTFRHHRIGRGVRLITILYIALRELVNLEKISPRIYYVDKGDVYGFWRVISNPRYLKNHGLSVTVRCYCGNCGVVTTRDLGKGHTQSCGCKVVAESPEAMRNLQKIWFTQVIPDKNKNWAKWIQFKKWALASGFKKNATLHRFNDQEPYSALNCYWETRRRIRGNNRRLEVH